MDHSAELPRDRLRNAGAEQGEEQLLSLLEAYDEQLARGAATPSGDAAPHDLSPELSARFKQACDVLAGFERARRTVNRDTADDGRRSADTAPIAPLPDCALDTSAATESGDRLALERLGRFEIVRELGRGAFGIVFLANDSLLHRQVALKVPRPEVLLTPDSRRRFQREAQAAARLTHPNLVPVYETGEVGPICFIAAMYCGGPTLAAWLRERAEPVSPSIAAKIVAQLADGVAYAHSQGILHRDIKPTNVLLERCKGLTLPPEFAATTVALPEALDFSPKLTDFGLAKIEELAGSETRTGAVMGTPAYMAPEQAAGRSNEIGPPADIFALGTMLYELLTRRAPFAGSTDAETLHRLIADEPIALRKLRRDVAPDLDAICLKCLEKQPASRYPSCAALAADLRRFLAGEPTQARPAGPAERLLKWSRRRPAVAALVAVSCLAVSTILAGSGLFSWRLAKALEASEERRAEAVAARTEAERHRNEALRERDANEQYAYAGHVHQAFQALAQGDVNQVGKLLSAYDEGTPYAGLRGFEWHYLKRSMDGERLLLRGHEGEVYGVTFSPDGRLVVSGGEDGTIRLWDPASGQLLRTVDAHTSCTNDLDFSPDGSALLSASCDNTVRLWDTASWRKMATYDGHRDNVLCVSFSPDGSRFASGDAEGWVRVWDSSGREPIQVLHAAIKRAAVNAVAWSADGLRLVAACQGVRIWDTTNWDEVGAWPVAGLLTLAVSPDGKRLALNSFSEVEIRDIATGSTLEILPGSTHHIQRVAFSSDGRRLLTCGSDRQSRICSLLPSNDRETPPPRRGAQEGAHDVRALVGHTARVQDLAIAADGHTLATASFDGTVGLWDLNAKGGAVPVLRCTVQRGGPQGSLALSPDLSRLMVYSNDGQIVTWDVHHARQLSSQKLEPRKRRAMVFAPDGETFLVRDVEPARQSVGHTHNSDALLELMSQQGGVRETQFSADSQYIALAHDDDCVRVFNTRTGEMCYSFKSEARRLALSSDGRKLALMDGGDADIVLDLKTDEQTELSPDEGLIGELCFSPDDRLLAVRCYPGIIHLIDARSGQTGRTLRFSPPPAVIAWSPDSKTLALATQNRVTLLHVETGEEMGSMLASEQTGDIFKLQFSADCQKLAVVTTKPVDDTTAEVFLHIW